MNNWRSNYWINEMRQETHEYDNGEKCDWYCFHLSGNYAGSPVKDIRIDIASNLWDDPLIDSDALLTELFEDAASTTLFGN